jgi:2-oxoglutarate dehydrogenase E2 component (dihydrolipoamide succinyltransferase)
MATDVVMPQMGESIFEGTITKWLKKPGDHVQRDEPLFEISTDKVDAEIPSPASGVLKDIKANEGQTVQVNTIVATIEAGDGASSSAGAAASAPPTSAQPQASAKATPAATAGATTGGTAATDGGETSGQAQTPTAAQAPAAQSSAASGPATDVVMPQMGESIFEGTITKWLKKPGDKVQRDEPLFEISTDKVDAEIPSPVSGVLREIKAQEGQTVQVNTVVATIGGAGAAAGAAVPAAQPAGAAATQPTAARVPEAAVGQPESPKAAAEEEEEVTEVGGRRIRSSPLVRKIAKERGVSLAEVQGTGTAGRITKEDILTYIENRGTAPKAAPQMTQAPAQRPAAPAVPSQPAAAKPAAPAPQPFQAPQIEIPGELVPMTQMRKIIAQRMVESKHTSAHVHSVYEVDMTRCMTIRQRIKNRFEQQTGTKLTVMPFFCRAAVNGLAKWPIINASVEGDNIRYHREMNIGIAVALDWGLIVPVVKHSEERNFLGLQRAITDLADRARAKRLKPDEVQGGTFTITNPGNYGQMFGLPIIMQPQVAIMGVGNIKKMPVVVTDDDGNDSIAIRSICHISLGYDHRVVDGAVADQFLRDVAKYLENWNEELL